MVKDIMLRYFLNDTAKLNAWYNRPHKLLDYRDETKSPKDFIDEGNGKMVYEFVHTLLEGYYE
ncbi:MAG: hypothetical protein GTN36_02750 [Candidatus Aenigmarchaeota archaeon]|nr:hypothetical protein [Candidatus Aenigmarchaeota archaeon]